MGQGRQRGHREVHPGAQERVGPGRRHPALLASVDLRLRVHQLEEQEEEEDAAAEAAALQSQRRRGASQCPAQLGAANASVTQWHAHSDGELTWGGLLLSLTNRIE